MVELDDGRTLARVIELATATLVVLDKERVAAGLVFQGSPEDAGHIAVLTYADDVAFAFFAYMGFVRAIFTPPEHYHARIGHFVGATLVGVEAIVGLSPDLTKLSGWLSGWPSRWLSG